MKKQELNNWLGFLNNVIMVNDGGRVLSQALAIKADTLTSLDYGE